MGRGARVRGPFGRMGLWNLILSRGWCTRGPSAGRGAAGAAAACHQHVRVAGGAGSGARVRAERATPGGRRSRRRSRRLEGPGAAAVTFASGQAASMALMLGAGGGRARIVFPPTATTTRGRSAERLRPHGAVGGGRRPARPRRGRAWRCAAGRPCCGRRRRPTRCCGWPTWRRSARCGGGRRAVRGGQHGRDRAAAEAARVRRGGLGVLADQVDLRPLGRARRRGRHQGRGAGRRGARLADGGRRDPRAVRELAGAARDEDAAAADRAAVGERARDRAVPGRPSAGDRGALPGARPVGGGAMQMPRGFGPLLSFEIAGTAADADAVVAARRGCTSPPLSAASSRTGSGARRWAGETAPRHADPAVGGHRARPSGRCACRTVGRGPRRTGVTAWPAAGTDRLHRLGEPADVEDAEAERHEHARDQPEADDDGRLGPAGQLEVVLQRRHPEDALVA